MKKLFALLGLLLGFSMMPALALAAPVPASQTMQHVQAWHVKGNYTITFDCATCVPHAITINSYNRHTGVFSGYGTYAANPAFTWTVSGKVTGNNVTMRILYTGQGAGYYVDLVGTISRNGTMSGRATDSSGQHFNWMTTRGHAKSCWDRDDSDRW